MDNFRTWRGCTGDGEGCRIIEKAAFGAPFSPTVSRIEVRVLGGWMTWAEASRSSDGSDSGKIISWGWNDLNWCSRELHGEIWPADLWRWEVTSEQPACAMAIVTEEQLPERAHFFPDVAGSCELGLGSLGHRKPRADKDSKGTSQGDHSCSRRKLSHCWSALEVAALLGMKMKTSVLRLLPLPFSSSISKPHLCSYMFQAHHLGIWKVPFKYKWRRIAQLISKGILVLNRLFTTVFPRK